ncbi:hypothetical protein ASD24_24435 [Paenibacillus sp. Root52]|uniref:hypothetical protein n=1 Tax=Paenibacillus sp. Root52 TaxID=1736552 RepID=UPI0006F71880|nr:hypothetical protein [Paenibacillus sp. Root52]KQY90948.1 hypothetical protein ASD24_24435 [Paenibacillus sp. Root52]
MRGDYTVSFDEVLEFIEGLIGEFTKKLECVYDNIHITKIIIHNLDPVSEYKGGSKIEKIILHVEELEPDEKLNDRWVIKDVYTTKSMGKLEKRYEPAYKSLVRLMGASIGDLPMDDMKVVD